LNAQFCVDAVREALDRYGWPETFNTDQGCQYTSEDFTDIFEDSPTRLSMDGKGRAFDNIFVERLWRTVKYEDVYIRGYRSVKECKAGLERYFTFYNDRREHFSLDGNAPSDIYFGRAFFEGAA
ncbi:MAG: integrase core domain-containing protein, partial [Fibrobacteraceae bacterium]